MPLSPKSKNVSDIIIQTGMAAVLVVLCFHIFSPFLHLMVWALILAIALYPLQKRWTKRLGNRPRNASIALVLLTALLIGGPLTLVTTSLVSDLEGTQEIVEGQAFEIPAPKDSVKDWPFIGEKVYTVWTEAAEDLPQFQKTYEAQLTALSKKIVGLAVSAASAAGLFMAAMVVAGIMMAFGESGERAMHRIFRRFLGPVKGPEQLKLTVATVRSVGMGVIGVAFFQSLLFGVGCVLAGIPFPGIIAVIVLLTGIVQFPAAIFGIPAVIYIWSGGDASVTVNIALTIYFLIASLSDNVLKPMMLGRGVDAPLPVILIGALGGMMTAGFVGLFLGAVLLAVGYQIFMDWVSDGESPELPDAANETPSES